MSLPPDLVPSFISIDWDCFIEADHFWEHATCSSDAALLWKRHQREATSEGTRISELAPLRVNPVEWWNPFRSHVFDPDCRVTVSESHVAAYSHVKRLSEKVGRDICVINYDAHGDMGYDDQPMNPREIPDCNNWLGLLLVQRHISSVIQVYPEWRINKWRLNIESVDELFQRWKAWYSDHFQWGGGAETSPLRRTGFPMYVLGIHICRSDPWTPPDYDTEFLKLVDACPVRPVEFLVDSVDPREPRQVDSE